MYIFLCLNKFNCYETSSFKGPATDFVLFLVVYCIIQQFSTLYFVLLFVRYLFVLCSMCMLLPLKYGDDIEPLGQKIILFCV